ncbi:hypothetical protein PISMIDRAFT_677402 [Pisolithus microcarpus 441]|uniref:Uncharacterized protein n=1 Tax=Pisolithus microcarpus 441 TaxID=765257 RepID=A0A0C9Z7A9_9AGAM|nr:hypothetical protein PISMIDRAFT_677402 [Pisolithus microcarpus 441]
MSSRKAFVLMSLDAYARHRSKRLGVMQLRAGPMVDVIDAASAVRQPSPIGTFDSLKVHYS